jgi:tetratricopeptide (TPR) repeat protein
MKYSAFISYNHRDRKVASWLHSALETYRIPRALAGRETPLGVLGRRLPPVFQDRAELAASTDLAASVLTALEQSNALIVICSPNGRRSRWVNEEIRTFTRMGRRHRIQCLIAGGEPNASNVAGMDPELEALPPALFEGGESEPLGADIRPGQDGRLNGKLKLLAGLLGVDYDELRQREAGRRQRRLAIIAAASGVGFVAMSALAVTAVLQREEAIRQRDIARQKTLTAERTVDFVKSIFAVADPSETRGATITAREILDRGAARIDQGLEREPTVRAELGTTLGEVYTNLGLLRQGQALVARSLSLTGVDTSTRARELVVLGEAQWLQSKYDAAAASHRQAISIMRTAQPRDSAWLARAQVGLAEAQSQLGDLRSAEGNLRTALASDMARVGPRHADVARDFEVLGETAFYAGDLVAAKRDLTRGMTIRIALQGANHPRVIQDQSNIASVAYMAGDLVTAEDYFRRALVGYESVLGPDHPEIAGTLNNIGRILLERRKFSAAEPLLQRAVDVDLAQRDDTAGDLAFEYANLAIARRGLGQLTEADGLFAKAEAAARLHKHRNLAPILLERAEIACVRRDGARGLALLAEAAPLMASAYKDEPWRMAWLRVVQSDCLGQQGQRKAAEALLAANAHVVSARWAADTLYGARLGEVRGRAAVSRP